MKLVHVVSCVDRQSGGVGEVVRSLSEAQSLNNNVSVISLKHKFTDADLSVWLKVRPDVHELEFPRLFRYFKYGYSPSMMCHLREVDADIFHSHGLWMYPSYACMKVSDARNIPRIISPHGMLDSWALKVSSYKKRAIFKLYEQHNMDGSEYIHALCKPEYESIRALGLKAPVCVIPNGIDTNIVETNNDPPWKNEKTKSRKVLLYIGRIHEKKGLRLLVDACVKIKKTYRQFFDEWVVVICGWDQYGHSSELSAVVTAHALHNDVILHGPVYGEDKAASLREAKAFVLPSYSEGLPMTVLEAWAHKLPVIMTKECNLDDGFKYNAAIKISTNIESISEVLSNLVGIEGSVLAEIGLNGYNLVCSKYSWAAIERKMNSVYEWMLGGGAYPDDLYV